VRVGRRGKATQVISTAAKKTSAIFMYAHAARSVLDAAGVEWVL
jgi:hypothetical protein